MDDKWSGNSFLLASSSVPNQCWLVTQFEGLELPVLVLVCKTQTLFGPEFGTGFESLELKLEYFQNWSQNGVPSFTYLWNWNWNLN
jgi:hypothetical protein